MGSTTKKPAELSRRHGEANPTPARRLKHDVLPPQPPPPNLLAETETAWELFWESDLAQFIKITDLMSLGRLFVLYDELERSRRALYTEPPELPKREEGESYNEYQLRLGLYRHAVHSAGRLVRTDKGIKLNPLLTHMKGLEADIRMLEDRFGLNLKARQELGLNRLTAQTLAQQNRAQLAAVPDDDDEDDPVAALL